MKKRRHWKIDEIGGDLWWQGLRKMRVSRRAVEGDLRFAGEDPHGFYPDGSRAHQAAAWVLYFQKVPTYGTLMYLAHQWSGRSVNEWIAAQYATFLETGSAAQREAALYSLWVDYFEVPARAKLMFPRLMKLVSNPADVIARSGPVPWAVKRPFYREAAKDRELHAALAEGLAGSFFNVFGSVDAREAKRLFDRIEVKDQATREALERITTRPNRWRVRAVVTVDERDPRWTEWAKKPSFLVLLEAPSATPWVPHSEVFHRGRFIGQLMHHSFPFDRKIRHRAHGQFDGEGTLFRMEGHVAAARDAIGETVDVWPEGLKP